MAVFPHLGNCDILSQTILCCRMLSCVCKMFSSLYQLDASSTLPNPIWSSKTSPDTAKFPLRGKSPPCWELLICIVLSVFAMRARSRDSVLEALGCSFTQGSNRVAKCGILIHARLTGQEHNNLTLVPKKQSCQGWVYHYICVRIKRLTWKLPCNHSISHGYWENTPFLEFLPSQHTEHRDWNFA